MRPAFGLSTDLWREIVERLDEGVIVFNQRGVAIYANDEAARLLDYNPRDVLELEKDDLVALCDLDRLDGARFARAFLAETLPPEASRRRYELVTARRRLEVRPVTPSLEHGAVLLLLLRELTSWRSELIARTMASEMHGPLAVIAHYAEMLASRLDDGSAHPFELHDLVRIIKESQARALELWETLTDLHTSDPRQFDPKTMTETADLPAVLRSAIAQVEQQAGQAIPTLRLELPPDLPRVRAAPPRLHYALVALISKAVAHLPPGGSLTIAASSQERYVRVDLRSTPDGSALPTHLFDTLPLANVEQTIMRSGGRVWTDSRGKRISFSLPAAG